MDKFFENIKFKYNFRDYQQEALDMLDKYKNDKKIHIVAAPGAGKTILALELMVRIGKKTLILAPTIAIKEQWSERLRKDFINVDESLLSNDLETPGVVTIITYQSLDAMKKRKVNIEKIIKQNEIKTIILDEAHHLRKVWFKNLQNMFENLDDITTIALTATPPYDNGNDFVNYMGLCGDIDAKITIPQLVGSNCLCPHQDYIYFNLPNKEQEISLITYREETKSLIQKIKDDINFIKLVALHDYLIFPEENVSNILDDFDFYISILSFLKEKNINVSKSTLNKKIEVPKFKDEYLGIILEKYLFGKEKQEELDIFEDKLKYIKDELNKLGAIDEKKINFRYNKKLSDIILKNEGKLDSINDIIKLEFENLKEKLKLVVVTDFIKDEFYEVFDEKEINEVGAIPIFRRIIADPKLFGIKVGILTGSFVVIPTDLKEKLYEIAEKEYDIKVDSITVKELGIDFNYSKVEFEEKYKRYIVNLITKLFEESDISVLIGTIALIGEGWDAPFVNSLIMASFIASYVTSNQVRGRAIRIDKNNPNKISNIWHLVCLENDGKSYVLGQDYDILSRRFLAYDGLDLIENKIDNGIDRLHVLNKKYTKEEVESLNYEMFMNAKNRLNIKNDWQAALKKYVPISREVIPVQRIHKNKGGRIERVEGNRFQAIEIILDFSYIMFGSLFPNPIYAINGIILNRLLFGLRLTSEKDYINKACKAVFRQMKENNLLNPRARYYINQEDKKIAFGVKNADTHEQIAFIKNVKQVLNLNSDSRYIIKYGRQIFTVPDEFSKNNEMAEAFRKKMRFIGKSELIYTKSTRGREKLLEYRLRCFQEND